MYCLDAMKNMTKTFSVANHLNIKLCMVMWSDCIAFMKQTKYIVWYSGITMLVILILHLSRIIVT